MSLGIFYCLFQLLERECHKLDLADTLQGAFAGLTYYKKYSINNKCHLEDSVRKLKEEVGNLQQLVTLFTVSLPPSSTQTLMLNHLSSEIRVKKRNILSLVSIMTVSHVHGKNDASD